VTVAMSKPCTEHRPGGSIVVCKEAVGYEGVRALVAGKVDSTKGKISAKRLLPVAVAAGYTGSARNFRRLVAQEKNKWRQAQAASRGPPVGGLGARGAPARASWRTWSTTPSTT
jgi:hypothetical protein